MTKPKNFTSPGFAFGLFAIILAWSFVTMPKMYSTQPRPAEELDFGFWVTFESTYYDVWPGQSVNYNHRFESTHSGAEFQFVITSEADAWHLDGKIIETDGTETSVAFSVPPDRTTRSPDGRIQIMASPVGVRPRTLGTYL